MFDFFRPCRHFCTRATIHKRDFASKSQSGSCSVHCYVARSDDNRSFCPAYGSNAIGLVRLHKVDSREIFVCRIHAVEIFAFDVHKHRDACAACDKHRVIFFEQFFNEHALSDDYVGFYFDTERLHSVNLLFHERFRKSKFGNSVYEHSACFVQRFEYRHVNTCASKVRTARKSGRAGTDNRNALAYRLSRV